MQTSYDKENVIYAGFFSRLAAYLIDGLLVSIGLLIVKFTVWIMKMNIGDSFIFKPVLFQFNIFDILYYLITVGYFILATYYCSTTLGKYLMKLKVVDKDGQKLTFLNVVMRETIGRYLSALIIYVGYFMIGWDTHKQGLHDKISDTYVIYVHKKPAKKPVYTPAPVAQVTENHLSAVQINEETISEEALLAETKVSAMSQAAEAEISPEAEAETTKADVDET